MMLQDNKSKIIVSSFLRTLHSRHRTTSAFSVSLLFCCLISSNVKAQTSSLEEDQQHVIVISLDGLAAFLVDDPRASLPTIRKLAREGAIAEGGMKVSNPSVTWPNHTTLITGVRPEKHGVLANGVLVRSGPGVPIRVDPKRDRADLVRSKTIVDAAHLLGLKTGEINWPCTRNSQAYDDSFPDVPDSLSHTTPRLRKELVQLGMLEDETDKSFSQKSGPGRDWVWMESAIHLIRNRPPNLLLVHLLNVDSTHHALGPQTPAGYTANAYADLCLERIINSVREAGILDRTTIFVVSDHGFITTPKAIKPNVLLRDKGWLKSEEGKVTEARVTVYPEGGIGLVYCTNPAESREIAPQISQMLLGQEGVEDVVLPDRYTELGLPLPREYEQAPDAVLVAKEGYAVSASADGDEFVVANTEAKTSLGSHGFVSANPKMNGLCVLWGPKIRSGVKLLNVENVDIAPTIAELLRLPGIAADGKVLSDALK